jgi:hypothetical protein
VSGAALELTDGARARIKELQVLSERAEEGDQEARRELRRALRSSAPEVIARCADTSRGYRRVLAQVRKLEANTPGIQFNTQINV